MRKTIFPWLFDDTPLPSTLSAINAIDVRQLDGALPSILRALEQSIPPSDPMRSTNVIARLQSIAPKAPEEVVEAVRSIFAQQGWNVQGDVYQADRDFHLTITQPEIKHAKMIVERWQTWVALFIGVLTMMTSAVDLPSKIRKIFVLDEPTNPAILQPLSGVIWDEGREPLAGVEVVLPEFKIATKTDRHGAFAFQVQAHKQRTVDLMAMMEGYILCAGLSTCCR